MRSRNIQSPAVAVLAGLALAGSLAACSSPAGENTGNTGGGDAGGSTGTNGGGYADGTYTATGQYQAPSGTESVEVTVTLEDEIITDVQVVGHATDPEAKQHQAEFISGIANEVVGKDIDELQVSRVAGSSLTSGGFNAAIETIKADAAG